MSDKKRPTCPVCHGALMPMYVASPFAMGQLAVGMIDTKGNPLMQVRCSVCGAVMLRKADIFQEQKGVDTE